MKNFTFSLLRTAFAAALALGPSAAAAQQNAQTEPQRTVPQTRYAALRTRTATGQRGPTPVRHLYDKPATKGPWTLARELPQARHSQKDRQDEQAATRRFAPFRSGAAANRNYPDLHASITQAIGASRSSRIANLITASGIDPDTKRDYIQANGGGVGIDNMFYCNTCQMIYEGRYVWQGYGIRTDDWFLQYQYKGSKTKDKKLQATDLSYDPVSGKVYGCFYKTYDPMAPVASFVFATEDFTSDESSSGRKRHDICTLQDQWNGFAINSHGQGFAIDMQGQLLKVSLADGSTTVVGSTGLKPYYASSAHIDLQTDRMFYMLLGEDKQDQLYEINTETAEATLVQTYDFSFECNGMFTLKALAPDEAPGCPTDIAADFPDGSYTGTVSFTMPATLFGGGEATGSATWHVMVGDTDMASGTAQYGERVTTTITFAGKFDGSIDIRVENEDGRSPQCTYELRFIGTDAPERVAWLKLALDGETAQLTWPEVTECQTRYHLAPGGVTYDVVRYPDSVVVATGVRDTCLTDHVQFPEGFSKLWYEIECVSADSLRSGFTTSNPVGHGTILPPYRETFDESYDLAGWTFVNANGDEKEWEFNQSAIRVSYNSKIPADDWAITPPIALKAGEFYRLSFDASSNQTRYKERLRLFMGTEPSVSGMQTMLLDSTIISADRNAPQRVSVKLQAPADQNTYFGIHACSDKDLYELRVDNFELKSLKAMTPDQVTDVAAVATDPSAAVSRITFKAPAVNVIGQPLEKIDSIVVMQGDSLAASFAAPAPGAELAFDFSAPTDGMLPFTFTPYNEGETGTALAADLYIGIAKPDKAAGVTATEDAGQCGTVHIAWQPVDKDIYGGRLTPELVSYSVIRYTTGDPVTAADHLTATTFTDEAVPAGAAQQFVSYAVVATDRAGHGAEAYSQMIAVGEPDSVPYTESFAGADISHALATYCISGLPEISGWTLVTDDYFRGDLASYDHDGGFIACRATQDEIHALQTGKINIGSAPRPALSFYICTIDTDDDKQYTVRALCDGRTDSLATFTANQLPLPFWNRVSVDLAQYRNKTIQIEIVVNYTNTYSWSPIDRIEIASRPVYDAAAVSITAPATVRTGDDYTVQVTVENRGRLAAGTMNVALYKDGTPAGTAKISQIATDRTATATFPQQASVLDEPDLHWTAKVIWPLDLQADNDTVSAAAPTHVRLPQTPTARSLTGTVSPEGDVRLTWQAPDLSEMPATPVTEDFESQSSAANYSDTYAGWTFVDNDRRPVGQIEGLAVLEGQQKMSWYVVNTEGPAFAANKDLTAALLPHSGTHCLWSNYTMEGSQSDDWAISPEISPAEQDISFWARAISAKYPEKIEVLYSSKSADPADFEPIAEFTVAEATWEKFTATVPAGAKYFALRSRSTDEFILMVDDISYIPAAGSSEAAIAGYNVYRDSRLITPEPIPATAYTDLRACCVTGHDYQVTTVYTASGESRPSETFHADVASAIAAPEAATDAARETRYDLSGRRISRQTTATGVTIRRQQSADGTVRTVKTVK